LGPHRPAPDLVLLHGLLGCGRQWRAAADIFSERFTCWVLELPGISSSHPVRDSSLPGLAQWLGSATQALGLSQFSLIGSSWGGALALEFAARSALRGRVHRLVLVAPAHPFWNPSPRQQWLLTPPWTRLAATVGALLPLGFHRRLLAGTYGDPRRLAPASITEYRRLLRRPGLGAAVANYARAREEDRQRLREALAAAPDLPPTLLVWGERDAVVPAATAPVLARSLPGAHLIVLPGLGHLPFEEDPEAFTTAVLPFL